jgi:DNA-binding NarL/FixJ family response regulator
MREETARRTRRDLARLATSGLDWITLSQRTEETIRRAVPFGPSCWHTLDPATLLFTGGVARDLGDEPRLPYHEYAIPDASKWAFLARSRRNVASLTRATRGHEESSPRYRELLKPRGVRREMRGSLVSDGAAWGAFGMFRTGAAEDFDEDEEAFLQSVVPLLADGFRRALLLTAALPSEAPDGPGIVVFDEHEDVESVSEAGSRWLAELSESGCDHLAIRAVAVRARRAGNEGATERSARARAYTRSGRWLTLHGTRLQTPAGERIAVVIEPSRPHEIAPIILHAYGLSDREREVAQLCLQGWSTAAIANRLHLSPYTVQDYLKSIFSKAGVRSRRDLVAKIFNEHYWPNMRPVEGIPDDWDGAALA